MASLRLGWWWRWVALAWALVAVVGAVMAASVWVFESETPPDRCWNLPEARLASAATGDFLGLSIDPPPGAEERVAAYDKGTYRLIYQYPDRLETFIREVMEGKAETEDDLVGWAWTRLVDSLEQTTKVPKAVVFFVHGHAGSGRQIKELSVALQTLRPTLTDDPVHHSQLAVFGVHFRGELSALQGDVLRRQAMYVNDCIYYLLHSVYPVAHPPKIVVIGHSMGGVVARAALMMPNRLPHAISALITLGAPLQMSLWPFDPSLSTFYHELNTYRPAPNESVPTFSIAGGLRDHLIRTELSAFYGIEPSQEGEQSAFAFTTAIPGVSTSIDHDSLLTCGQFITVLGRCILHIVNPKPVHNYSSPREQALAAFKHHFLSPVPRLLGLKPGVLDSIVDAPHRAGNSAHNVTTQANHQTETIDDPRYYLYEPTLKNTTQMQLHRLSLSTWRKRYGQMQLVVATDLPPHALTVSLTSKNGTNSSIPGNWWIEAPMGYAPRAFVGVNSTQKTEAPRLLIVPAETLNQHDVLVLKVSPRTPDQLDVSNNVTAKPTAGSSFLFAQLYNEYATQIPVFDDDGGQFTVEPTGPLLVGGSVGGFEEDQIRPAVTHFTLPGNTQPVSVWVNPSGSSSSTTKVGRPMWEPIIYQYSTCSSLLFEEENVYVDTSPAVIRSHYRTIPQLYRECSREESTVHLFLFTDPQYEYQVVIEPHLWVTVGHMFSTFVTLSLPAAFFVFALVFAVQRWTLARTGSLHSFAWTLLRLVPVLLAAALCASAALYVFDPPVFMLHESALVFANLSPFTPSFSFHHDPVTNQRILACMPVVVFTYGTLLVLAFATLQVCLVPCVGMAWRRAAQARDAIGRRAVCQRAAIQRVSGCLARPHIALLIKVAVCILSILVWRSQPFFTAIVVAFALTLVWVEDEALRYFRQSLSVLLALFLTYHFGCLWFSWAASHPFDGASAFTLPTIALALYSLCLTEMPHTPVLHYFLAVTGAGVAGYLFLFSWHAVHMIVYAVIALSVCTLLGLVASLLHRGLVLAAQLINGPGDNTTALHGDDSGSDSDDDESDGSVPLSVWSRLRRALRRFPLRWRRHYSRTEAASALRPEDHVEGDDNL